jgi:HK97 gp10 family phage protein
MPDAEVTFNREALGQLLVSDEAAKDLQRRALKVDAAAKRLCPVDTGRLRGSITNQLGRDGEGLFALVGSDVDYAIFVELGTRHAPAQPYLRPALGAAGG